MTDKRIGDEYIIIITTVDGDVLGVRVCKSAPSRNRNIVIIIIIYASFLLAAAFLGCCFRVFLKKIFLFYFFWRQFKYHTEQGDNHQNTIIIRDSVQYIMCVCVCVCVCCRHLHICVLALPPRPRPEF